MIVIDTVLPHSLQIGSKGSLISLLVITYSSIYGSYPPNFWVSNDDKNRSLNQVRIPCWEITDNWSLLYAVPFNCSTEPLLASVKYLSAPHWAKLSGLLDIPNSSILAIWVPRTSGTDVRALPPAASDNKFFPASTYDILSSCKTNTSVSRANNLLIGPNELSNVL